jgi:pilus assembly protein CpaE
VLREANAPARIGTPPSTLLTVLGVKGGVGKTTIATNLAAAIAHDTERSVLLVDLDSRFGDLAVLLDLKPRYSIVDLARAVDAGLTPAALEQALTPHESGVRVLAAPRHPAEWGQVTPDQLRAILSSYRRLFDYVILDTPGAYTDLVATAIEEADRVLLLSSLERTSIKNTRAMLALMEEDEEEEEGRRSPIDLIFNQVHASGLLTPEDAAALVPCSHYAHIPYDARVLRANTLGSPVVLTDPAAPASRQLRQLAAQVAPADAAAFEAPASNSILRLLPRLPRWFRAA